MITFNPMEIPTTTFQILSALNAVQFALSKQGITKDRQNQQQGFRFRGIDDVMNAVSPLFAKHGIVLLPAYSERTVTEHQSKAGSTLFYTSLKGTFNFKSKQDGSSVEVTTYGEAMDSGDKSTNKAMAAAMKYALLQALLVPTEADNDPDSTTHQVAPKSTPAPLGTPVLALPAAWKDWTNEERGTWMATKGSSPLKDWFESLPQTTKITLAKSKEAWKVTAVDVDAKKGQP